MKTVVLYGDCECFKTKIYQDALKERGVDYTFLDVCRGDEARNKLVDLVGSADKFPLFEIDAKVVRNPSMKELDQALARAGIYDPGLIHNEKDQRFIRYMAPKDAFVSYTWRGETMVLGHIEVDPSLRGTGRGARFAGEVFDLLLEAKHNVRITCSFMRKVASRNEAWTNAFGL